jgi:hypothetical protein
MRIQRTFGNIFSGIEIPPYPVPLLLRELVPPAVNLGFVAD